jgi:hypothetical protein
VQAAEEAEAQRRAAAVTTTIKIGVPSFDGHFWPDLLETEQAVKKAPESVKIIFDKVNAIHQYCLFQARNMLLYGERLWWPNYEPPFDYFFSMDDDNGISLEGILELVRIAKANGDNCIVSAAYRGRWGATKEKLVAGRFTPEDGGHEQIPVSDFVSWPPNSFPREVDTVGGGACLIPKKVIMALPQPLYQHEEYELPGDALHKRRPMNEDQALCRAVKKAGFKVLLARVVSSHRGAKIEL